MLVKFKKYVCMKCGQYMRRGLYMKIFSKSLIFEILVLQAIYGVRAIVAKIGYIIVKGKKNQIYQISLKY